MKRIFIVGSSEPSLEIVDIINKINCQKMTYDLIGYFDEIRKGKNIFNNVDELLNESYFIISIGNVVTRERIFKLLLDNKFYPEKIISPDAYCSKNVRIGKGVLVYPNCSISCNTIIDDNVLINFNSSISHGVKIGKNSNICPGVNISGNVEIGENTFIGVGTKIIEKINVCSNVYIGANSTVVKNIDRPGLYFGTPCEYIKDL